MSARRSALPRTVVAFGVVSFFTDVSSEAIFPLLPLFLTEVLHAPATALGFIEGVADAVSNLLKIGAGRVADRLARKKPLVLIGYGLSTLVRPLVAFAAAPWHVLLVRAGDRVGKGLRTAPRDAMIASATPLSERGRAFGFQRALDHAGAAVGTLLGSGLLALGLAYRSIFLVAAIPGVLAVLAILGAPEPPRPSPPRPTEVVPHSGPAPARALAEPLGRPFWGYVGIAGLFALANSSDAFLLLKVREVGASAPLLPVLWLVLHLVKAAAAAPGGRLADRFGHAKVLAVGWALYAGAYAALAASRTVPQVFAIVAVYGLVPALTEGAERALVAELVPADRRGRAYGYFNGVVGVAAIPAGVAFGAVWGRWTSAAAFGAAAVVAGLAAVTLGVWAKRRGVVPAGTGERADRP